MLIISNCVSTETVASTSSIIGRTRLSTKSTTVADRSPTLGISAAAANATATPPTGLNSGDPRSRACLAPPAPSTSHPYVSPASSAASAVALTTPAWVSSRPRSYCAARVSVSGSGSPATTSRPSPNAASPPSRTRPPRVSTPPSAALLRLRRRRHFAPRSAAGARRGLAYERESPRVPALDPRRPLEQRAKFLVRRRALRRTRRSHIV